MSAFFASNLPAPLDDDAGQLVMQASSDWLDLAASLAKVVQLAAQAGQDGVDCDLRARHWLSRSIAEFEERTRDLVNWCDQHAAPVLDPSPYQRLEGALRIWVRQLLRCKQLPGFSRENLLELFDKAGSLHKRLILFLGRRGMAELAADLSQAELDSLKVEHPELARELASITACPTRTDGPGPPDDPKRGDGPQLTFKPGAFIYRGQYRVELCGKPLQVIETLAQAPGQTCTAKCLLGVIWPDVAIEEDTLRSAVSDARKALRKAKQLAGESTEPDPIPAVDRGSGRLAWCLRL